MRKIRVFGLLAVALALGGSYACDSANPVAPPGTVLRISASPTLIGITGGASTITVTGFRPDGNPLNPGTQITFTTSLGTIAPTVVEVDDSGSARATLTSNGQSGTATVTATTTAGETMAEIMVTIGDDDTSRPQLFLSVAPAEVDLNGESEITIDVRNADGTAFGSGGQITLTTTLGRLESQQLVTNAAGRASTRFFSGDQVGTATIRAFLGSATAEAMVMIANQQPQLLMTANPTIIAVSGQSRIQILARDENGIPLGAGQRIRLVADLGSIQDAAVTDANGEAEATFTAATRAGTGSVTATLGTSAPVTVNITIRSAVGSLNLIANPSSIQRLDTGVAITLTATVLDAQGDALGGILVFFNSPRGSFSQATNGQATTNAQGVAVETLTVDSQDLQGLMGNSFDVSARATSEGVTVTDSATITVTN